MHFSVCHVRKWFAGLLLIPANSKQYSSCANRVRYRQISDAAAAETRRIQAWHHNRVEICLIDIHMTWYYTNRKQRQVLHGMETKGGVTRDEEMIAYVMIYRRLKMSVTSYCLRCSSSQRRTAWQTLAGLRRSRKSHMFAKVRPKLILNSSNLCEMSVIYSFFFVFHQSLLHYNLQLKAHI